MIGAQPPRKPKQKRAKFGPGYREINAAIDAWNRKRTILPRVF